MTSSVVDWERNVVYCNGMVKRRGPARLAALHAGERRHFGLSKLALPIVSKINRITCNMNTNTQHDLHLKFFLGFKLATVN